MSQTLFAVFPVPVLLALGALVALLLAVGRVLVGMCRPVPLRLPSQTQSQLQPQLQPQLQLRPQQDDAAPAGDADVLQAERKAALLSV
jgi:hypothetical protein